MKSKQEIHKAIAAMTIIATGADTENSKRAKKVASALCWVLDYPNDFGGLMEKVDESGLMEELDLNPDKLDIIIQESIAAVMNKEGEGFGE